MCNLKHAQFNVHTIQLKINAEAAVLIPVTEEQHTGSWSRWTPHWLLAMEQTTAGGGGAWPPRKILKFSRENSMVVGNIGKKEGGGGMKKGENGFPFLFFPPILSFYIFFSQQPFFPLMDHEISL